MRGAKIRDHADGRLSVFLRLQRLRDTIAAEAGRLLRFLFIWFRPVPARAGRAFRQERTCLVLRCLNEGQKKSHTGLKAYAMQIDPVPELSQYWATLEPHLPTFSVEEQRVAIGLYRELAKGNPVEEAQLARALGFSIPATQAFLQRDVIKRLIYSDDQGRVLGFGGLAATAMHHRFETAGQMLSTWCAWDSLFIPGILGWPARVSSPDPESGEIVHLIVTPERIHSREPDDAVISFVWPQAQAFRTSAANVMAKFCHFIFFFASPRSGERWVAKNPGTFLYSLDDAFSLAKLLNAHNFGSELAR
jgi:alkylmercury lyase